MTRPGRHTTVRRKLGRRRRPGQPEATFTLHPEAIVLLVVQLFLLTRFSASGEVTCVCRPVDVPWADHASELVFAPVIEVRGGEVVVGGQTLGPARALDVAALARRLFEDGTRMQALSEERGPFTVALAAERGTPFLMLRPLFEAVARSGAQTTSLIVLTSAP